jgi:hypothetical protein
MGVRTRGLDMQAGFKRDADLCADSAPAYSRFIPPGGPSRPWQLITGRAAPEVSVCMAAVGDAGGEVPWKRQAT